MNMGKRNMKELQKTEVKTDYSEIIGINSVRFFTYLIIFILFLLLGKIVWEGSEVISWKFLTAEPRDSMTGGGIGPAIFGTLSVMLLMIIFAIPIGVFSAIYISEYAKDNFLTRLIRAAVNNLAGVPSIVIGLFGLGFFVLFVGKNIDEFFRTGLLLGKPAMLWASATLGVLVLPTVIVATIEAINSVPLTQRTAAYSLGATKWQAIKNVVLPQARPGILTGIILAVSRGAGETAPVLFLGCAFFLPDLPVAYIDLGLFYLPMVNPAEQFMYLSYHIFILATQSANPTLTRPIQFGTTLVLIIITVLLNLTAVIFRYKFRRILSDVSVT